MFVIFPLVFNLTLARAEPRRSLRVFQSTSGSRLCTLGLSKRQIVRAAAGKLQAEKIHSGLLYTLGGS